MNVDIVVLRLLHIVSGAFWVGTVLFMVLIFRPRVRSFGSDVDRRLIQSIDRAVYAATGVAGLITVAAGIGLVLKLRWGHLDTLFNSGWGFAIQIGFIATMAAFVVGGMGGGASARAASIRNGLPTGSPSPDGATLQALDARIVLLERLQALFVLIAVGSMASARFV